MRFTRIHWIVAFVFFTVSPLRSVAHDFMPPRGGHGRIQIVTHPSLATAYMNGVKLGLTPVDTPFASGRFTLTIFLDGEELVRQRVNIWPDSTTRLERNLFTRYGSILLKTNPQNRDCTVYVDSQEVASTQGGPLTLRNIRAGRRNIRILCGKEFLEYALVVVPEKTVDLMADFVGPPE